MGGGGGGGLIRSLERMEDRVRGVITESRSRVTQLLHELRLEADWHPENIDQTDPEVPVFALIRPRNPLLASRRALGVERKCRARDLSCLFGVRSRR